MPRLQSAAVSVYDIGPALPTTGDNAAYQAAGAVQGPLQFRVREDYAGAEIVGTIEDASGLGNTVTVQVSPDGVSWSAVTDVLNSAWYGVGLNGAAHEAVGSVNLTSLGVAPNARVDFGFSLRNGLDKYVRFTALTGRAILQLRGGDRALCMQKI